MKKFFKAVIAISLIISMLASGFSVFAYNEEEQAEWQDISLTDDEFNSILANNPNSVDPYSTGLINLYNIAISKDGNTLKIAGKTIGTSEVIKSGFKKVVVQRRANSTSTWSNYQTYKDIYSDSSHCLLGKTLTVPSGYQYRVTCVHYAKKNFLSTQTINNTSNTLTF